MIRSRKRLPLLLAAAVLASAALPPSAMAAHRPDPFVAKATISACKGDGLTIAAEIAPSRSTTERASRRALRAVRGARLRLRFEAAPLYGRSRRSREIDLGRTTTGRRFERFGDLPGQTYHGVVRFRWVRGSRTVRSGLVRTRRVRAAGRRGRAFCSLRVGKKPVDTQPPFILPFPSDPTWRRAPLDVYFFAIDDLSGVALVVSQIDGGPFTRGRVTRIATEGSHQLTYVARDVAGNQTAPATITLRVDANPPSTPNVITPSGRTSDTTPDLRWGASSDTASGVAGYLALVRDAAGAIVWAQFVGQSASPAVTVGQALAPGQYTAEVVAFDGTTPEPFTSTGTSTFSVVPPGSGAADSDGDGVGDASDNCPFAANGDQADLDADAAGDVCDADDDADTVGDASDNCPRLANANQANFDGDAQGDACDSDDDNDGLADAADPNDNDTDSDDDGINDGSDACPSEHRGLADTNNNGCPGPS